MTSLEPYIVHEHAPTYNELVGEFYAHLAPPIEDLVAVSHILG